MVKTNDRIKTWSDSITLWNDIIDKHPDVYKAWYKRGQAKMDELQENQTMTHEHLFKIGQKIKIIDGPFATMSGVITDILTEKQKLSVDMKIFNRTTPIELNYEQAIIE